jgi:hypothetical protein
LEVDGHYIVTEKVGKQAEHWRKKSEDQKRNNVRSEFLLKYGRTPLIRIKWDEPSGYADNPDNWIFV